MNRTRAILGLLAVLGIGAASALGGPFMSQYWNKQNEPPDGIHWGPRYTPEVPTVQGAWGQPVEVASPYNIKPPNGADAARAMLAQSMPLDLLQQSGYLKDQSMPIMPVAAQCPGGMCPPPGAGMPGMMPPGNLISPPGVGATPPGALPPGLQPPGAVAAVGALTGNAPAPFPIQRTEVRFVGPPGMKISWFGPTSDGKGGFGPQYLEAPARYNYLQASIYRLKLSDIPNRPGVELYPTLEVVPAKAKTCTFLAHSAVPVSFTEEDFDQVAAGNFVVKVIYLPDPQFQDLAATGPDEVVSSRLEPGVDPIIEAKRRGCILLVVRLGNIDLEAPNTPSMDAPNPFAPPPPHGPPGQPALPPSPGLVTPGLPGMPGAPNPSGQMAPNLPPRPPMVPYGMLTGQPPQPGGMQMPPSPGAAPAGPMLPPVPGAPGSVPGGAQPPFQPGTPLGANPTPSSVQPAQFSSSGGQPASNATPQRRPTLAELASQPANLGPSGTTTTPGGR
ncbi:MAG TPA: hypothetical protein VH643_31755 [Gemmataceae bacterium]|jgi:hypothetical protein